LVSFVLMRAVVFAMLVALMLIPSVIMAQGTTSPVITAPFAGQVLQGQISITGSTDVSNFVSAELDFAYASDTTGNWFLIQAFAQPVANSALAAWDTASISDGDYILRLRVTLQDGTFQDATEKVRVQNETPLSTPTPTFTPLPTLTPVFTPQPVTPTIIIASPTLTAPPVFSTPTSLPPNPVEVQKNDIYTGIEHGALIIAGLFIFFGILIRLRRS
jgi:hypothetical protein